MAEYCLFYRALLQKRPIILWILLTKATPYPMMHLGSSAQIVCHRIPPHCNTLQDTAIHSNTLQHTATHCITLQHTATHCNTLQHSPTHFNTLQHNPTHCDTLQHTATHCNTLQHTATHMKSVPHDAKQCNTRQLLSVAGSSAQSMCISKLRHTHTLTCT